MTNSNIFSRIGIGTANFAKEYNGVKIPEKDIEKILGYCQCSGIDLLDCATAYGWDWTQANSYFNKIIKIQSAEDIEKAVKTEPHCIMAHGIEFNNLLYESEIKKSKRGISLYSAEELNQVKWEKELLDPFHVGFGPGRLCPIEIIQIPYSLYDRRWETYFSELKRKGFEIHARSIFLRGKIITDGIPAEECIKFVLANPYIDKIIIGVESFEQLQRNLDFIHKWNNFEKHNVNLLDTRKW